MKKDLINLSNQELTLDSREVAEMVEKQHAHLLRDIKNYTDYISTNPKLDSLHFFKESMYKDAKGEERPCYQITKKGCEFIAHKLTGQKGAIFTATYINRFHEMDKQLNGYLPKLSKELQAIFAIDQRTVEIDNRVTNLENTMTIDFGQQQELQNLARSKAIKIVGGKESPAYRENGLRSKIFSSIWKDYKDYFGINSYRNTPRKDLDKAIEYIQNWQPQGKLLREIEDVNMQLAI